MISSTRSRDARRRSRGSLSLAARQSAPLSLVPQVIYEFWAVATRPVAANGLGMTAKEADADVAKLRQRFRLLLDERGVFENWLDLVKEHQVLGKNAHDARLVAAMHRHGLTGLLTFNGDDFKRYPNIEVLDPLKVATPQRRSLCTAIHLA